ncbi:MAG: DUF4340 domain-containing protein [Bryobacteraceae bacterium]
MRSEFARTLLFVAGALALVVTAASFSPETASSEIFSDTGEEFFPGFRDASKVAAIEVVDYDETEAVARPLKVELRKGRYVITSHGDYPAEAKQQMASTAAALVDLKKEAPVSDRWEDQASYSVIDPLDAKNASLTGRGKRVTLRDAGGLKLAEIVLGNKVKEKEGYRYARLPGQKRTYEVKTAADPSAEFADWVEANLLRVRAADILKLTLNSYQIDEQFGRIANLQRMVMARDGGTWSAQANAIANTMASLRVVGARPKPPELAEQLKKKRLELTLDTVMSLRQRGYFIAPTGMLLSNEGELLADTSKGLTYVLRFGEVVTDSTSAAGAAKPRENRYLFVTVSAKDPGVQAQADALDAKFADWYYVIRGEDFARLHPAPAKTRQEQPRIETMPPVRLPPPPPANSPEAAP